MHYVLLYFIISFNLISYHMLELSLEAPDGTAPHAKRVRVTKGPTSAVVESQYMLRSRREGVVAGYPASIPPIQDSSRCLDATPYFMESHFPSPHEKELITYLSTQSPSKCDKQESQYGDFGTQVFGLSLKCYACMLSGASHKDHLLFPKIKQVASRGWTAA